MPQRLGYWLRDWEVIRFSPLDLRVILRVACFVVLWKFLSIDYSALPDLRGGPEFFPLPGWLNPLVHQWQALFFDAVWKVKALQGLSALFLLVSLWRLPRWAVLLGMLPVMLVEWNAFFYRGQMYDLDVPAAILLLAAIGPWKKMLSGGARVTAEATWMGVALTAYMGGAYFLSGWSKLVLDPVWWEHIRLDLLYPTMELWHGYTFPGWLQPVAAWLHHMLEAFPDGAKLSAFLVLIFELGWILAVVSRTARFWLPLCMLASHLFIFLSSGILFLTLALMAFILVVPWRNLFSPIELPCPEAQAETQSGIQAIAARLQQLDWLGLIRFSPVKTKNGTVHAADANGEYVGVEALLRAALRCPLLAIPAGLAFLPGLAFWRRKAIRKQLQISQPEQLETGAEQACVEPVSIPWRASAPVSLLLCVLLALWAPTTFDSVFPFARYNQFGWSYAKTAEPATVYRLGYQNPQTGEYKPLPNNYGGFMDYRLVSMPGEYIQALLYNRETQPYHLAQVGQFIRAIRPNHSDAWLLGALAFPDHFIAASEEIPAAWLKEIYLLEGHYTYDGHVLHGDWIVRGRLRQD